MRGRVEIRTSEEGWLARLAENYRQKNPVLLIDDAKVGIDPSAQSLWQMGRQAGLRREEWAGVLVSLGMVTAGIGMTVAAILDPEPTSKLGLLVAGGIVCTAGGGFSAVRILTKQKPPDVRFGRTGIHIEWK